MNKRFQGDPAIRITPSGASMKFIAGQPVLDQGLENYVTIKLTTLPGWWGNILTSDQNKKIGSNFTRPRTHVDIKTVNDIGDDARLALRSMTESGLASKIDIDVRNPRAEEIQATIKITPPGGDTRQFIFTQNGLNWIAQATDPAHDRFNGGAA